MQLSEFIQANLTAIFSGLSAVIGALAGWYATRKRENRQDRNEDSTLMRSDFDALVKANTAFREEIRKDLEIAKKELENAKLRIVVLEKELESRAIKIMELERTIAELTK